MQPRRSLSGRLPVSRLKMRIRPEIPKSRDYRRTRIQDWSIATAQGCSAPARRPV